MASPCKSQISQSSSSSYSVVEENDQNNLRRGPWTLDEDSLLIHSISLHGEGRWNLLAIRSGLRRTGKSCRLRWLNYLKPEVKRGNLSPQEQLLILDLHSRWGNKWSKIAQYLPGRTDNEIKNYWRTQVQKQAKILNIDANSAQFKDIINSIWIPRLVHQINESSSSSSPSPPPPCTAATQLSGMNSRPAVGGLESGEELSQVSDQFSDVPSWNHGGGEVAAAEFGYPINDSGLPLTDWIDGDDSFGGCLWNNFDGLWQF